MQVLKIALLGLGNVGQGVVRVLAENRLELQRRLGADLQITHIAARRLEAVRDCDTSGMILSTDAFAVATADVDIVVEAMGGIEPAKALITAALKAGKHVVTANKALLAEQGNELFALAAQHGKLLAFEASVAGGIPIIKTLREGLAGNRIDKLAGIINGTCNYILSQMSQKGLDFAVALAAAQRLGYAEADPTFDIEGIDAAHKLTILASLAFGIPLNFDAVAVQGITKVTAQDIAIAQTLGYRIKLLGLAKRGAAGVELRVQPTLVSDDTLLAKVENVLNCVLVQGNAVGEMGLYGRGAGGNPTASAVVADLADVARFILAGGDATAAAVPALAFQRTEKLPLVGLDDIYSAHYLRLKVADQAGVLQALTTILAAHQISIEAILQKEPRGEDEATVALITNVVREGDFNAALAEIRALPFVRDSHSHLRVEPFAG